MYNLKHYLTELVFTDADFYQFRYHVGNGVYHFWQLKDISLVSKIYDDDIDFIELCISGNMEALSILTDSRLWYSETICFFNYTENECDDILLNYYSAEQVIDLKNNDYDAYVPLVCEAFFEDMISKD